MTGRIYLHHLKQGLNLKELLQINKNNTSTLTDKSANSQESVRKPETRLVFQTVDLIQEIGYPGVGRLKEQRG